MTRKSTTSLIRYKQRTLSMKWSTNTKELSRRIQPDVLSISSISSLSKRAKTCTALSVYRIWGSCPMLPANPPARQRYQYSSITWTIKFLGGKYELDKETCNYFALMLCIPLSCWHFITHEITSSKSTESSFPRRLKVVNPQYAPFILRCSITTDSKLSFLWKVDQLSTKERIILQCTWKWIRKGKENNTSIRPTFSTDKMYCTCLSTANSPICIHVTIPLNLYSQYVVKNLKFFICLYLIKPRMLLYIMLGRREMSEPLKVPYIKIQEMEQSWKYSICRLLIFQWCVWFIHKLV